MLTSVPLQLGNATEQDLLAALDASARSYNVYEAAAEVLQEEAAEEKENPPGADDAAELRAEFDEAQKWWLGPRESAVLCCLFQVPTKWKRQCLRRYKPLLGPGGAVKLQEQCDKVQTRWLGHMSRLSIGIVICSAGLLPSFPCSS